MSTSIAEREATFIQEEPKQLNLADRAVLVKLNIGNWNERAVDKEVTKEVTHNKEASPDAGRFMKRLMPKVVTIEVRTIGTQARQFHNRLTMPWDDNGTRLLPVDVYQEYVAEIDRLMEMRTDAKNRLIDNYPSHVREAKRFLGQMFQETDYPSPDELESCITMDKEFLPVPDGRHFIAHVPDEEREKIRTQIEQRINDRIRGGVEDLYKRLYQIVSQADDRMKPGQDGKDKTFRNSMVANLKEHLETIPILNITDDPNLTMICKRLSDITQNLEPDELRPKNKEYDASKRAKFKATMSDMNNQLAGYFA